MSDAPHGPMVFGLDGAAGGGGGTGIQPAPLSFAAAVVAATTVTRYLGPTGQWGSGTANSDELGEKLQADTTLRRLEILIRAGAGNGSDIVYTVNLDGVATGLTLAIPSTFAGLTAIDLDVPALAGQVVSVEVAKAVSVGTGPSDVQAFVRIDGAAGPAGPAGSCDPLTNLV